VQSTVDQRAVLELVKINADMGRLGGLIKMWLTIGVETVAALVLPFGREVSPDVTARGVVPEEERLVRFHGAVDEVERTLDEHWFDVLHVGLGCRIHIRVRRQWTAVRDSLLADLAPARIRGRIIDIGGLGIQDIARAETFMESGVFGSLRIIRLVGFLHRVEVVEVWHHLQG